MPVPRSRSLTALLFAGALCACRPSVPTSTTPKLTASGGPPIAGAIPSTSCRGDAPVDDEIKGVPRVRASWFNDPAGTERLYVLEAGPRHSKQPSLVMIHGVGKIGTADFYPVLAELSRERHVIAVDLPGFGRSKPEDDDFGPERLVRSVAVVAKTCASRQFDVLGHSSGGAVAILFAAQHPDVVRRLIVADVAGILRPEVLLRGQVHQQLNGMREEHPVAARATEQMGGLLIDVIHGLMPDDGSMKDSILLGDSPPVRAGTALLTYDFGPAIRDLRAPTLIVWGTNDDVVPPRIAHLLKDRIATSELRFIDDAGHVVVKDQPVKFARTSNEYLDRPKISPAKLPGPNDSQREGVCDRQENVIFEGDYARILVNDCRRVWLNHARARFVAIKDSDGRIDNSEISEGLQVESSQLSMTGGAVHGKRALDLSDSEIDVAGVAIDGTEAAVYARDDSELVFSVTPLKSPRNERLYHEEVTLKKEHAL